MNDIDILVTAPLPPFLYDPLKADYRCHDYAQANDKAVLLAEVGARVRGLVQGGGTVTPTALLDALPAARDHFGVRRRLRRRADRLLPQARHQGHEHARRADRRRRRCRRWR